MVVEGTLLKAEDLLNMPEDGYRYELVEGELVRMTPTGGQHGTVAGRLHTFLGHFVLTNQLGEVLAAETGYKLASDPDTVRAPDVSFIAKGRLPAGQAPEGYLPFAPDLAVEVVSPSDTSQDVQAKVSEYLSAGTRLVWVMYPKTRNVVEYRPGGEARVLSEEDFLDGGDVVPGFRCRIRDLF
ncbi:MAG TPA: Uma2 family endonuclease [Anaerolineae bacterium]|nr:Uma2 family endonuclease [Anaerolineae bacterium]